MPDAAPDIEKVLHFSIQFGEPHEMFACQASVPLIFSTDLLYKIWLNFNTYSFNGQTKKIPHWAVSDLILSGFCQPVGYKLYKLDSNIRNYLLQQLVARLGVDRQNQLAAFLQQFAEKYYGGAEKNIQEIHLLTAASILKPADMAKQISEQLEKKMKLKNPDVVNLLTLYFNLAGNNEPGTEGENFINIVAENDRNAPGYLEINLPGFLQSRVQESPVKSTTEALQTVNPLSVSVSNGDLLFSSYPVMVGHFLNDGISGAEKAMDKYSSNMLSKRYEVGSYPGEIGTNMVLIENRPEFKGTVIVGLGTRDRLNSFLLVTTIEKAAIQYMQELKIKAKDNPDQGLLRQVGISVVLIGSESGMLSVESSVRAILTGIQDANRRITAIKNEVFGLIDRVEFIEISAEKCSQCLQVLNKIEAEDDADIVIHIPGKAIKKLADTVDIPPVKEEDDPWSRVVIQMRKQKSEGSKQENPVLHFSVRIGNERIQEQDTIINPGIIDPFLEEISVKNNWNADLAKTIFNLLIPNELKYELKRPANMLWVLDTASAAFPWELLQDGSANALPLCCKGGMIRQLVTNSYFERKNSISKNTALIVGDPDLKGYSYAPQILGAFKEATLVANLLAEAGYEMPNNCLQKSASQIIQALFTAEYKIIHFAGHGIFNEKNPGKSGMLIGDDIFLTTREIAQMSTVPELAFINCAFSGKIDERAEELFMNRNKLAANIGTQLIGNGVKAVVIAGWSMDDAAAVYFTEAFYKGLLLGLNFGDAISEARVKTFNKFRHTNTWGAYQCYGDPHYRIVGTGSPAKTDADIPGEKKTFKIDYVHTLKTSLDIGGREHLLDELTAWWQDPGSPVHVQGYLGKRRTGKTAIITHFINKLSEEDLKGNILVWSFGENADIEAFLKRASVVFRNEEPTGIEGIVEKLEDALRSGNDHNLLVLDRLELVKPILLKHSRSREDEQSYNEVLQLLTSIAKGLGNTRAIFASQGQIPELSELEGAGYIEHDLDNIKRVKGDGLADYKNDVYISYVHNELTTRWIEEIFLPLFENYLDQELNIKPRIFFDKVNLNSGDPWPEMLQDNLLHSKMLIAILTPRYFQNTYSLAAWLTFTERARLTKSNLAIPIVLRSGEYLNDPLINQVQHVDFTPFNVVGEHFNKSEQYLEFNKQVSSLATRLGSILNNPPAFDPGWTVIGPGEAAEKIGPPANAPIDWGEADIKNKEPEKTTRTIRIFLSSSTELKDDRDKFEIFIAKQNDTYRSRGIWLELIMWENFIDAISATRLQDEYNNVAMDADIFVMLFFNKVSTYVSEEFEHAFGQF